MFLVVDREGNIVYETPDIDEVLWAADRIGVPWQALTSGEPIFQPNAGKPERDPLFHSVNSLISCGLGDLAPDIDQYGNVGPPVGIQESDVRDLDPYEAYERLRQVFSDARAAGEYALDLLHRRSETTRMFGERKLHAFLAPVRGMFLGVNAKLTKQPTGGKTISLGLSLLPESTVFGPMVPTVLLPNPQERAPDALAVRPADHGERPSPESPDSIRTAGGLALPFVEPIYKDELAFGAERRPPGPHTLCAFSSVECRATCLVLSGQNQADIRNNYSKFAKAKALLLDPVAFMSLLLASIKKYANADSVDSESLDGVQRFCRLNVVSDVPWELVVPWMFDPNTDFGQRPGDPSPIRFYDYTKIPGRRPPENYHLTFSFSGANYQHCNEELARGRNITVVFVTPKYETKRTHALRLGIGDLPKNTGLTGDKLHEYTRKQEEAYYHFNPIPGWISDPRLNDGRRLNVIDGDRSDIRPYDRHGCVVALRWKPPRTSSAMPSIHAPENFVVHGDQVESDIGPVFILPETPMARPISSVGGNTPEDDWELFSL